MPPPGATAPPCNTGPLWPSKLKLVAVLPNSSCDSRARAYTSTATANPAHSGRGRLLGGDLGFSLIEVLVGALMIVLLAGAAATALISTAHTSADQRLRSQADELATQDQERLRGLSDEQLTGLSQTRPVTVNGSAFTVTSVSTSEDTTGTSSCASTAAAAYYRIVSTVSWTETNATQNVVEDPCSRDRSPATCACR